MLFFKNITDITALKTEKKLSQPVVILFMVDGYEELISGCLESEKAHVSVQIDKLLEDFAGQTTGVLRKNASDRFIAVIEERHLQEILSNKVEILDKAREIFVNDRLNVTMSIGIGRTGKTLKESEQFARQALEMALGRGGDQAVVKYGDKTTYFGGKSAGTEKSATVKARVKAQAFQELLTSKDSVIIMAHKRPDADAFGSAVGVYRLVKTLNKKAYIVVNEVTSAIRPIISGFMGNSVYGDDMIINSEQAISRVTPNTLVVVTDVNKPSMTECEELLSLAKSIVVFDHHRQSDEVIENATLSYIEPYASSACEMIAEILQYIEGKVKLRPIEADAMYAGIVIDTDNFLTKTGVRTFDAASYLRRSGADVVRVRKMFRSDMYTYRQLAEGVINSEIYMEHFAISTVDPKESDAPTVVAAKVANDLLNIEGIRASFVTTEKDGTVYMSARSVDDVNVQIIMEKMGGGGHANIAGAQFTNSTNELVLIQLKTLLDEMYREGDI